MIDQAAGGQRGRLQPEAKQDARDLLARLYREIGISAVAAALAVNVGRDNERENLERESLERESLADASLENLTDLTNRMVKKDIAA